MTEIWKDISGYEGLYQVSNMGFIKRNGKILSHSKDNAGYCHVNLSKHGKAKTFLVHRLVALDFLNNENNFSCVNHKDESTNNNCADNLEWCTPSYNNSYGLAREKRKLATDYKSFQKRRLENIDIAKRTANTNYRARDLKRMIPVKQYNKHGEFIKLWACAGDAGKALEIFRQNITACCLGNRKSAGGFIWKYRTEGGKK